MNQGAEFNLRDAGMNGVYFVGTSDAEPIAGAAVANALLLARINLAGCDDKADLLGRIATALSFPASFGENWDALEDSLGDLSWLPASGYVLLFEQVETLRAEAEDDFDTLLDILDDNAADAAERQLPWHAFFVLPDADFAAAEAD